jgi:predicted glycogen debranching enzyme
MSEERPNSGRPGGSGVQYRDNTAKPGASGPRNTIPSAPSKPGGVAPPERSSNVSPVQRSATPGPVRPDRPVGQGSNAHVRALGSVARPVAQAPRVDPRAAFESLQIRLDSKTCRDLTRASKKEWLLTNGLGGYAMTTVSGLNTRRWHGLLVAAMRPPVGRAVVLSKMDETLDLPGGPLALDTNFYPGVVHPRGFEHLESFTLYPFPTVVFGSAGWRLEKSVMLVHGENTVVVTYKMLPPFRARRAEKKRRGARPVDLLQTERVDPEPMVAAVPPPEAAVGTSAPGRDAVDPSTLQVARAVAAGTGTAKSSAAADPAALRRDLPPLDRLKIRVRPLFAFRAAGELTLQNDRMQQTVAVRPFEQLGSIARFTPYPEWEPVYLVCAEAPFVEAADWYKNVEYPQERYRGLDYREDLWTYGYYEAELRVGESISIACTLHSPDKRLPGWPVDREIERRAQALTAAPDDKPFARRLVLAADQFLVRRERDVAALVPGYPWLEDCARDAMIALPGLLLVTGKHREAKSILRTCARSLDRGMLPNKLPESGERPDFGSVDATLWFFVTVFKYLQYTGDFDFVKTELRIPMLEVVRYYSEGTRHGIRVDGDGMLRCGEPGSALTWMDARVGDVPVTQRVGKPVEVNALWYNALRIMERLAERFSIPHDMARFGRMAEKIEENFLGTFWNAEAGCLSDVVGWDGPDRAVRPNQLLAVSLPFPLLDSESALSVVRVVGEKLQVAIGLRTLDPQHPDFKGVYDGDPKQRDSALHQGTVWAWWMGPYISALVKANGGNGRVEAAKLLKAFEQHLMEDGLGQISEIFWGNPPHWPRGVPAHATAVAEILRVYHEDVLGKNPGRVPGVHEPTLRPR